MTIHFKSSPVFRWCAKLLRTDVRGYKNLSQLGADSENPWIQKSAQIPGWLFEGEHQRLWELATESSDGDIAEIGTWMGKSACIFAGACIASAPETRVWCIDPFTMLGPSNQMNYHHRIMGKKSQGTFYQFCKFAESLGFSSHVLLSASV